MSSWCGVVSNLYLCVLLIQPYLSASLSIPTYYGGTEAGNLATVQHSCGNDVLMPTVIKVKLIRPKR